VTRCIRSRRMVMEEGVENNVDLSSGEVSGEIEKNL
jgi:hypothetical protein